MMYPILKYVVVFAFGLLVGNFATTLQYRLPRGITIHGFAHEGKPPFCSACQHHLRFYEYLPILNWVFVRGTCNYCGVQVPHSYALLELLVAIWAIITLHLCNGSADYYLIYLTTGVFLLLGIFIYVEHGTFQLSIFFTLLVLSILHSALLEQTLIYSVASISIASVFVQLLLMGNGCLSNGFRASQRKYIVLSLVLLISWFMPTLLKNL